MKFSIVTPSFNSEQHIRETIESVIFQEGNFEIEYIIADGQSKDRTVEVVEEYISKIKSNPNLIKCNTVSMSYFSEKDRGMYDAINKGFSRSSAGDSDVLAWINSDDKYLPGAFDAVRKTFESNPEILWVKGITRVLELNNTLQKGVCFIYNQPWIRAGIYGVYAPFIHQDSVFWRKSLWNKAGPINSTLKYAGDYELWTKMAVFASLWSLNLPVSVFRKRSGQLSANMTAYRQEQKLITEVRGLTAAIIKIFFWLRAKLPEGVHHLLYRFLFISSRNTYYIGLTPDKNPEVRRVYSFVTR